MLKKEEKCIWEKTEKCESTNFMWGHGHVNYIMIRQSLKETRAAVQGEEEGVALVAAPPSVEDRV